MHFTFRCTPLWYVVYKHRKSAMCVIHTHSMNAQLATMLDPTEEASSIKITHLEMLKGVGHHAYDDVLEVPIIDNRPTEDALADQLEAAVLKYPKCNAVLVRRHGSKFAFSSLLACVVHSTSTSALNLNDNVFSLMQHYSLRLGRQLGAGKGPV